MNGRAETLCGVSSAQSLPTTERRQPVTMQRMAQIIAVSERREQKRTPRSTDTSAALYGEYWVKKNSCCRIHCTA